MPKDRVHDPEFEIRFFESVLRRNPAYASVVERNPNNSLLCQISEEQAGPLAADPMESTLISDDATANAVIDWLVAHRTIPSYYVEHPIIPSALLRFRLGDNIDLVDPEIYGCTDAAPVRATIEGFTYQHGSLVVGLRLWPILTSIAT